MALQSRARAFRAVIVVLAGLVLSFGAPSTASAQDIQVSTQPALYPAFDPGITDYVTRCSAATPVGVTVSAPAGTTADVDGQGPRSGDFTTAVSLGPGQGFSITASSGASTATYYVRCLPSDFPHWTFQRSGSPQAEWYGVAPFARTDFQPVSNEAGISLGYAALFDANGVPVWWTKSSSNAGDFKVLSDGNVAWTNVQTNAEERRLDGSLVRTVSPVGATIDSHEVQLLANGDYLITVSRNITGPSPCGGPDAPIFDNGAQEIAPDGTLVWSWWASDHIPVSETPADWCTAKVANGAYDAYHINSLEPDGDGVIMSFRHLDAIYRVNKADGSIAWKLGGVTRPESLTVLNDPLSAGGDTFRGQHDARRLSDGTVTVHDNGFHTASTRPPRAVRWAIDPNAMTATLVEQKNDPDASPTPLCCGSARKLPGGDWVMSWGSTGLVTELRPSGSRVFSLTFDDGLGHNLFSYRAHPVLFGTLSPTALRDGMQAQFPRGYARPRGAAILSVPLVPAFKPCLSPDLMHGSPLVYGSCSSPTGASSFLTVGTPDANGEPAKSVGAVVYKTVVGDPSTPANEADVLMTARLSDVRRKTDLSDYTGQLQVQGAVRITDEANGSLQNEAATGLDTEFPVAVPCVATPDTSVGSTCSVSTSFNAVVPGTVVEGARANWQFGQVQVFDGGTSETAGGSGATLFETQGVFVP